MKSLFTIIILMAAFSCFASDKGNGGDAVICRNKANEITSAELLDNYEARVLRQINPVILSSSNSWEINLEILMSELEKRSPVRARIYSEWLKSFFTETIFVRDTVLVDIPDSQHLVIKKGCQVEQVAIQQIPRFPQDKRYIIDAEIWDKMDNISKAGLIFHELVFREVIESNPDSSVNSIEARYFHSLVSAGMISPLTLEEFNNLFKTFTSFNYFEIDGLSSLGIVLNKNILYSDNGQHVVGFTLLKIFEKSLKRASFHQLQFDIFTKNEDNEPFILTLKFSGNNSVTYEAYLRTPECGNCNEYPFTYLRLNDGHLLKERTRKDPYVEKVVIESDKTVEASFYGSPWKFNAAEIFGIKDNYGCMNIEKPFNGKSLKASYDINNKILKLKGSFKSCSILLEEVIFSEEMQFPTAPITFAENSYLAFRIAIEGYNAKLWALDKKVIVSDSGRINFQFDRNDHGGLSVPLKANSEVTYEAYDPEVSFTSIEKVKICSRKFDCRKECKVYKPGSLVKFHLRISRLCE